MSEKKSMLDGEKQYHIQLQEGDIADFVILPGDPGRVDFIAKHFDDPKEIAFNREYKTVTGTYKGEAGKRYIYRNWVSICSNSC